MRSRFVYRGDGLVYTFLRLESVGVRRLGDGVECLAGAGAAVGLAVKKKVHARGWKTDDSIQVDEGLSTLVIEIGCAGEGRSLDALMPPTTP
jgi:hypothetical protein